MQKLVIVLSMGIFIALAVFVSANIVLADDGKQSDSHEMSSKQISREDIGRKMRVAVANGDITAEEAREKWAAMEAKKGEAVSTR